MKLLTAMSFLAGGALSLLIALVWSLNQEDDEPN